MIDFVHVNKFAKSVRLYLQYVIEFYDLRTLINQNITSHEKKSHIKFSRSYFSFF